MLHIFHFYLKGYDPRTAQRRVSQRYTNIQTKELNKHYADYFSLTEKAKCSLATSLGITPESLRKWMRRKWKKEKGLKRTNSQLQTPNEQKHGIQITGMYM